MFYAAGVAITRLPITPSYIDTDLALLPFPRRVKQSFAFPFLLLLHVSFLGHHRAAVHRPFQVQGTASITMLHANKLNCTTTGFVLWPGWNNPDQLHRLSASSKRRQTIAFVSDDRLAATFSRALRVISASRGQELLGLRRQTRPLAATRACLLA